jgi:hypothetical protein
VPDTGADDNVPALHALIRTRRWVGEAVTRRVELMERRITLR